MDVKKWLKENGKEVGLYALTMTTLGAANSLMGSKIGMETGIEMGKHYAELYNSNIFYDLSVKTGVAVGSSLGALFGTGEGLFWLTVGNGAYEYFRFRINPKKLDRWRGDSIQTAGNMEILERETLSELENATLNVNKKPRPESVFYGSSDCEGKEIEVYSKNFSQKKKKIPKMLKERGFPRNEVRNISKLLKEIPKKEFFHIYNQSGMDHEIIGHMGNYLEGNEYGQKAAFETQRAMAEYRGEHDENWELMAGLIPIVETLH